MTLDQVVLPQEQKSQILSTLSNWGIFVETRKNLGIDQTLHYGRGIVLLFSGPSGTGKTMVFIFLSTIFFLLYKFRRQMDWQIT